jgi:hypothetical protein
LLRENFSIVANKVNENSIDVLHIDETHTYETVREVFFRYLPKMVDNGVILLRDVSALKSDFGVFKLWQEVSQEFESLEFSH